MSKSKSSQVIVPKSEQSEYNIKAIRVYQPVQFEGALRTYFAKPKHDNMPMADIQMEIVFGNLVRIKTAKDDVLIPFTNVAFIALNGSEQTHENPIRLEHE